MPGPTFFRRVPMAVLAQHASELGLVHVTSLGSTTVPLPPLVSGAPFVERWALAEEPAGASGRDTSYATYAPWVFVIPNAIVHANGMVCVGDFVIEETLVHTNPVADGYRPDHGGIWINVTAAPPLPGAHISTLCGSAASYYHALIDGIGRLSALPANILAAAAGLLVPAAAPPTVAWLQDQVAQRWSLGRTRMAAQSNLRVEQLVLAQPNDSTCNYHPCLAAWFGEMAALAHGERATGARRFFVDRRDARSRPLANEDAVIAALEPLGIEPVAAEHLSGAAQIALFRHAELVVGPHGAGLANLLFASPGCRVIELQMDAYCHWGFRRIAALKGLPYDCVVGRLAGRWPQQRGAVQGARWQVSVPHVAAAVQAVASQ